MKPFYCAALVGAFLLATACSRQNNPNLDVDPPLGDYIARTPAIDNHAHPMAMTARGQEDHDYDALPADGMSDIALPVPSRITNPRFADAWSALFGYKYGDLQRAHVGELVSARQKIRDNKGELYPSWVLNQAKTDIMLANRTAMGAGLPSDRFKWVPFVDMFLFPLNNAVFKNKDPEHSAFVTNEEKLLKRYLAESGLRQLPSTFDEYLTFIAHMLSNWKAKNAVALKFEFAYLRDLQISNPPRESAERVYSIYAQSSEPTAEDYKLLQDYLFRYLCLQAGQLSLPVHIHSSVGAGSYFQTGNANPMALQSLFNDPALHRTKFVMLHGAWPYAREAAALILKPNVYLDYSGFYYMTYPVEGARALRLYLEAAPERVLYGSDASPFYENVGWEETAWVASQTGRQMLGIALTGMVRDEEITPDRAHELAYMVLHGNAHQLYGF